MRTTESWSDQENKLLALNLRRIDALSRRGLLLFLDLESSKSNTGALREKARLIAIDHSGVEVGRDLARIEQQGK